MSKYRRDWREAWSSASEAVIFCLYSWKNCQEFKKFLCARIPQSPLLSAAYKGQGWGFLKCIFQKLWLKGCIEFLWPISYHGELVFLKTVVVCYLFVCLFVFRAVEHSDKIERKGQRSPTYSLPPQTHSLRITNITTSAERLLTLMNLH